MDKEGFEKLNKEALKSLEALPEIDFNSLVKKGNFYYVKPLEIALIKDLSYYGLDCFDGQNYWQLMGIAGKITSKENLNKFSLFSDPKIIASNKFDENGLIDFQSVGSQKSFSQIFGYQALAKLNCGKHLTEKEEIKKYKDDFIARNAGMLG